MERDREHVGIAVVSHLRAVAVVDVPVDDRYPAHAVNPARMFDSENDIGEYTEAAVAIRLGMVAAGEHQRIRIVNVPPQHGIDCRDAAARRKPGYLEAFRLKRALSPA